MENGSGKSLDSSGVNKMLFIELAGGIEQAMISLPSMHALALSNPQSRLEVLTFPRSAALLHGDPLIQRVHLARAGESASDSTEQAVREDVESLLENQSYDIVVSDVRYAGIDQIVERSSARIRISDLWRDPPPDQLLEDRFLEILAKERLIDPHYVSLIARIALLEQEKKWAGCWSGNNLTARHPTVIFGPRAGSLIERWAPQNFITVGRWLASRHHCNIVILSDEELELAKMIGQEIGKSATILAKGGIRQLAAIASLSALIISADASSARVAAAAGSRAIVLFGATLAGRYGLRPPHLNIQSPRECKDRSASTLLEQGCSESGKCNHEGRGPCVDDITPEAVIRAAERLLLTERS